MLSKVQEALTKVIIAKVWLKDGRKSNSHQFTLQTPKQLHSAVATKKMEQPSLSKPSIEWIGGSINVEQIHLPEHKLPKPNIKK